TRLAVISHHPHLPTAHPTLYQTSASAWGRASATSRSVAAVRQETQIRCRRCMYRRGNYSSGEDFVLEYGDLRFTFNERDFRERCEQAARKLGFLGTR